jgi:hypothetical protein
MADFSYFRVYADEQGETHFEDVRVPMSTVDFAPPAAPLDVASLGPATSVAVIGSDQEWAGAEFHPAPARQWMVILAGHGSITASDGEIRECGPGGRFLLEDTSGRGHSSRFHDEVTALVITVPDET